MTGLGEMTLEDAAKEAAGNWQVLDVLRLGPRA